MEMKLGNVAAVVLDDPAAEIEYVHVSLGVADYSFISVTAIRAGEEPNISQDAFFRLFVWWRRKLPGE